MQYFTTGDGLRLAFDETGAGVPMLCLAGLTRNMGDFEPVVERFAPRARIIRLDTRGRGASDHDPDFHNYNVLREGHDALELLDHLGLKRATILGTSRGGMIALVLAAGHADRVAGICLNDIGPVVDPQGLAHIMGYLGERPGYASYDDAAHHLMQAMQARFPGVGHDQWRAYARRLWIETPEGLDLRYDPALRRAVLEQSAAGAMPDLWPLFEATRAIPMALIRGANSDILSRETAAEMCARHPDMIYAEVPDRGHVPFLDEPESIGLIGRFLDRLET